MESEFSPGLEQIRSDGTLGRESSSGLERESSSGLHYSGEGKTLEVTAQVSRKERAVLMKTFRLEQRMDRRRNKLKVRAMWEAETADGKENLLPQEDAMRSSSGDTITLDLFERIMRYDGDAADRLVHFRASLELVPERDSPNEERSLGLRRNRTASLWDGLRRVYFGEVERCTHSP
jgi:hypothetical protein